MQVRLASLLVLAALLAGCASTPPAPTATPGATSHSGSVPAEPLPPIPAPVLRVGQSWTYRTGGYWDSTPEVTVIVARADAAGYLLAGGNESQLMDEVVWDRLFFGPVDRNLQQLGADGAPRRLQWLHFPIEEGATWTFYGANVTAHRGPVPTPDGPVQGMRIRGADADDRIEIDYAPSLGAVTHYAVIDAADGAPSESIDLVRTGTADAWTWLERGEQAFAGAALHDPSGFDPTNPQETLPVKAPTLLDVSAKDDAVVVWALASEGSHGIVAPPATEPWVFEGAGNRAPTTKVWPAAEGKWTLTGAPGDASGWVYLQAQALHWVHGP